MAAGKYSFTIEQGATLNFELQYKDAAGLPISLKGYEGAMQIRSGYSGSAGTVTYLTLTSSIGDVYAFNSASSFLSFSGSDLTTPVASGSIGIYSGWYATQGLTFTGSAYYDLEITSGSEKIRLLEGQVKLNQQVTQIEPA
jgi:hypothetical protein